MKNILYITALSILIYSCSQENKKSIDSVIESKNLKSLKEKREAVHKELEALTADLAKLDAAIGELDQNKKNPLVKIIEAKDTLFTHYIEIQGNIETKENIIIYPEFSGIITQINVKAGQSVSKGQILARIDDGGLSSQLAQAQSQLNLAQTTFERQKNLWDQKIGSEIQFLQAKTSMESQQKIVAQIKAQLAKTVVKAPFSGTIDEVMTEKGKVVGPGQELFRIVNLTNMYVSANVPETYIGQIKSGATVEVYLNAVGKTITGKVRQIGNYINPNNRTFVIEVALPNQNNLLRPNQVAVLKIEDYKNPNALLIPENIIQENANGDKIIYVAENIDSKNSAIAKQRVIEKGFTSGAFAEIKSGINEGEFIITDGGKSLKDGTTVDIINKI